MMPVRLSLSSLKEGRWYEYVIRFALGGAATVFTGLVSRWYGPVIGGVFLALPAIFCASSTLIEAHEIRRKRQAGLDGRRRGEKAAALEAAGTLLGSIGMLGFAAAFILLAKISIAAAFVVAALAWLIVSVVAWYVRRKWRPLTRKRIGTMGVRHGSRRVPP
ncbi:MAG TPA: DUF3147 family protein [Bradyrhizobium sp.]|uniref:DUF3147 family protein n=1 Tax=Bradyrhizobium sp. TaxID=376 RepID=UPI002D7FA4C5|nr:DUF3147 family protein [Bradyrhizobium sp.]HET7886314.1 DUF3147 family protein [Bradyrhizobium sp.]